MGLIDAMVTAVDMGRFLRVESVGCMGPVVFGRFRVEIWHVTFEWYMDDLMVCAEALILSLCIHAQARGQTIRGREVLGPLTRDGRCWLSPGVVVGPTDLSQRFGRGRG